MGLSRKRLAFISEYLKDFNATQAAIRAGYSEKSAYSIGSEILKIPEVSEAIQQRISEKAMGADEVLLRLAAIARVDIKDFLDIGSMGFQVDLKSAEEKGITHLIKKVKMRTTTTISKEGVETETHDIEIEPHDAQSALVTLGKYHKLFSDRTELTGKDGGPIEVEEKVVIYVPDNQRN